MATVKRWIGPLCLVALVVVAAVFRLWGLVDVPPGLHYDEAIDLRAGQQILSGDWFIYTTDGWGREASFYYFVALVLLVVPYNPLAVRVAAVLLGLGQIVAGYVLVKRWNGVLTALLMVGWTAVVFWPVSSSRLGVRNTVYSFFFGILMVLFWRAWEEKGDLRLGDWGDWWAKSREKLVAYILAGGMLGLTLYTYQPSRFVPVLFVAFFGYVLVWHRERFWRNLGGFVVFVLASVVVALPLLPIIFGGGVDLGESGRVWTIEPLTRLMAGDGSLIWENVVATAGMFSVAGDPLIAYNVPDRPVFVPVWTSVFFYAGLGLVLWRWKRPQYALVVLWLVVLALPTIVTVSAPNYNRTMGMQTAVFYLAALPVGEGVRYLWERKRRWAAGLPIVIALIAIVWNGVVTWEDYFVRWPSDPLLWTQFNGQVGEMAQYLAENESDVAAVISSRNIEDVDPYIIETALDAPEFEMRWADTGQAVVFPAGEDAIRLFIAEERWLDRRLAAYFDVPSVPLVQDERFVMYEIGAGAWPSGSERPLGYIPAGAGWDPQIDTLETPVLFGTLGQGVQLEGLHVVEGTAEDEVSFITFWEVQEDGEPMSLSFFVHLVNEQGEIVAQQDGLGFPPHSWEVGDRLAHVHRFLLEGELAEGAYFVQMGLYRRETGERWLFEGDVGVLSDRLIVGPMVVVE